MACLIHRARSCRYGTEGAARIRGSRERVSVPSVCIPFRGQFQLTAVPPDSKDLPDRIEEFLQTQRVERTRTDYARYLRVRFIEFLRREDPTDLGVQRVNIDSANRWRQHDLMPNVWIASHGMLVLKSFASWLSNKKYLRDPNNGRSVLMGLEVSRPVAKIKKAYDDDQLEAIWEALGERDRRERLRGIAYVHVLYATGLRRIDAGMILRKNLNLKTRWLRVAVKHGKGTEQKRMRLSRECVVAVQTYLDSPDRRPYVGPNPEPVFIREDGRKFTANGFGTWVNRISEDVKELTDIPWNPSLMKKTSDMHARSGISDPVLRRRVMHLLTAESDHDTAIAAACIVLEDRVREKSGGAGYDGDALMKHAFGHPPKPARLQLAPFDKDTEQWGALNIYRGVAAFYRNGTTHRTRPDDFDPDEAERIVRWVDHLLGLID